MVFSDRTHGNASKLCQERFRFDTLASISLPNECLSTGKGFLDGEDKTSGALDAPLPVGLSPKLLKQLIVAKRLFIIKAHQSQKAQFQTLKSMLGFSIKSQIEAGAALGPGEGRCCCAPVFFSAVDDAGE